MEGKVGDGRIDTRWAISQEKRCDAIELERRRLERTEATAIDSNGIGLDWTGLDWTGLDWVVQQVVVEQQVAWTVARLEVLVFGSFRLLSSALLPIAKAKANHNSTSGPGISRLRPHLR